MGARRLPAGTPPTLVAAGLFLGTASVGLMAFGAGPGAFLVGGAAIASAVVCEIDHQRRQRPVRSSRQAIEAFYAQYDAPALRECLRLIRALPHDSRANYQMDVRVIRLLLAKHGEAEVTQVA